MANRGPRILVQGVLLANLIDELLEWERIAGERWEFKNWKRSAIERESRRESVVYGNCLESVKALLGRRKVVRLMNEERKRRAEAAGSACPKSPPKK